VHFLGELYNFMDNEIVKYDVYKVSLIASGLCSKFTYIINYILNDYDQ